MQKPFKITIEISRRGIYCSTCPYPEPRGKGWRCRIFAFRLEQVGYETEDVDNLMRCQACRDAEQQQSWGTKLRNKLKR